MPGEAAHIAEDLLNFGSMTELERKCIAVSQSVSEGYFSFDDALKAYGISEKEYNSFYAKEGSKLIEDFVSHIPSEHTAIIIAYILSEMTGRFHSKSQNDLNSINTISNGVKLLVRDILAGRIKVSEIHEAF